MPRALGQLYFSRAAPAALFAELARAGLLLGVSGPSGSGKTQLAMQLAAGASSRGRRVVYQDVSGSLRPERLEQMGADAGLVRVHRPASVSEQLSADFAGASLLVSDDADDLVAFEHWRPSARRERERLFHRHVSNLARLARAGAAVAVFCSGAEFEDSLDMHSHVRARLSRFPRRCSCSTAFGGWGAAFEIGGAGLSADNDYLLAGLFARGGAD